MCSLTKAYSYMYCSTTGKKSNGHFKCNCTYLSFPNMGESPIITDAKADLTCWLGSITKSYGKINNVDNKHYTTQFSALHNI